MSLICHTVCLADISCSKEMSVACHEEKQKFKRISYTFCSTSMCKSVIFFTVIFHTIISYFCPVS